MKFFNNTPLSLGCSVFANSIRFAVASKTTRLLRMQEHGQLDLEGLAALLVKLKAKNSHVLGHLVLPHDYMIFKEMQFSEAISKKELLALIKLNSCEYFGYQFDMLLVDHEPLDTEKKHFRLMAIKKSDLQIFSSVFAETKVLLKTITADVFILQRLLHLRGIVQPNTANAVFLLDGMTLIKTIIVRGILVMFSTYVLTCNDLDAICKEIQEFIGLYENGLSPAVTHIVVISDELAMSDQQLEIIKLSIINHSRTLLPSTSALPLSQLLTLGSVFAC